MVYGQDRLNQIDEAYSKVFDEYMDSHSKIVRMCNDMTDQRAKEFILHGAGRRLSLIHQCIRKIFQIYPPRRTLVLNAFELLEISVNLHAFFINLSGIYDNLAWALVFERNLSQQSNKFNVTLYKRPKKIKVSKCEEGSQAIVLTVPKGEAELIDNEELDDSDGETYIANEAILTEEFAEYLNSPVINKWVNKYLRLYRDTLAHQIPVYLAPGINAKGEEVISPAFRGSMHNKTAAVMHPQLIADFNTIGELIHKFAQFEFPEKAKGIKSAVPQSSVEIDND